MATAFDQIDTNHDGVISRAEFNAMMGGGNTVERSYVEGGSGGTGWQQAQTGPSQSSKMVVDKQDLSNGRSTPRKILPEQQICSSANGNISSASPRSPRVQREVIGPGGIRSKATPLSPCTLSPCTPKVERFLDAGVHGGAQLGLQGGIIPPIPYGAASQASLPVYAQPGMPVYAQPGTNLVAHPSISDYPPIGNVTPRSQFRALPSLPGTPRGALCGTPSALQLYSPRTPRTPPVPVPVSPMQQHRPVFAALANPASACTPSLLGGPCSISQNVPPLSEPLARSYTPPPQRPFQLQLGKGLPPPPGISFNLPPTLDFHASVNFGYLGGSQPFATSLGPMGPH